MTQEEKAVVDAGLEWYEKWERASAFDPGRYELLLDLGAALKALRESRKPKPRYTVHLAANISGPDGGGRWDVYDGPQRIAHSWDELAALRICHAMNEQHARCA